MYQYTLYTADGDTFQVIAESLKEAIEITGQHDLKSYTRKPALGATTDPALENAQLKAQVQQYRNFVTELLNRYPFSQWIASPATQLLRNTPEQSLADHEAALLERMAKKLAENARAIQGPAYRLGMQDSIGILDTEAGRLRNPTPEPEFSLMASAWDIAADAADAAEALLQDPNTALAIAKDACAVRPRSSYCEAIRYNDEMQCARCGFSWELGDRDRPDCLPRGVDYHV